MARLSAEIPPMELQHVNHNVLEGYVKRACLNVAASPIIARRLNCTSDAIVAAFKEACEASSEQSLVLEPPAVELGLAFRHQCLFLGCKDLTCNMCSQNPNRQCTVNFNSKYLAGDILKAKCGATIFIEVTDLHTNGVIDNTEITDKYYVEITVMDGKAYKALVESKRENYDEDLESTCILTKNGHDKPLLAPGRAGELNEAGRVVVPVIRGRAILPDLSITGSSEALLSGQKPPFMLLVRAFHRADNTRALHVKNGNSEFFVVATPRVRTAVKAVIPHVDDHVSKLQSLGVMTQNKLADIAAAASAAGITYELRPPKNCVTTVGQFKELCEWSEGDRALCETLKKVLKLTKGWDAAKEHAMQAVESDSQLRIWAMSSSVGLLFKCHMGVVDLEKPFGLLQRSVEDGRVQATLETHMSVAQQNMMRRSQQKAEDDWFAAGHPNWRIWDNMTYNDLMHHFHQAGNPSAIFVAQHLLPDNPLHPRHGANGFDAGSGFGSLQDMAGDVAGVHMDMQPRSMQISSAPPQMPSHWTHSDRQSAPNNTADFTFARSASPRGMSSTPAIHGENGSGILQQLGSARGSDLITAPASSFRPGDAEPLMPPPELQPEPSPFAKPEHQNRGPGRRSPPLPPFDTATLLPNRLAIQGSLKRGFSVEGPKRKRQALDPESLQQRVSGLLGRPIDSLSLFKIMPYMPGAPENIYSGIPMDLGEQPEEHEERREHMPLRNPVGSGIDLLADVAQRESAAAQQQPQFNRVRSYDMPGGIIEYDGDSFFEPNTLLQRLFGPSPSFAARETEQLTELLEARLSARDLVVEPPPGDGPPAASKGREGTPPAAAGSGRP